MQDRARAFVEHNHFVEFVVHASDYTMSKAESKGKKEKKEKKVFLFFGTEYFFTSAGKNRVDGTPNGGLTEP